MTTTHPPLGSTVPTGSVGSARAPVPEHEGPRPPEPLRRAVHAIEHAEVLDKVAAGLERAGARLAEGDARTLLSGARLGHALHPLLTDLPLGCWLAAGLLDVVGGRKGRPAAQRLVALGLAAAVPTALTGMSDWGADAARDPRTRRVGVVHAVGNAVVTYCYLRSWRARRRGQYLRGVAAGMLGGGLAWVTGYLGGHLSFGRGVGVGAIGIDEPSTFPFDTLHAPSSP